MLIHIAMLVVGLAAAVLAIRHFLKASETPTSSTFGQVATGGQTVSTVTSDAVKAI